MKRSNLLFLNIVWLKSCLVIIDFEKHWHWKHIKCGWKIKKKQKNWKEKNEIIIIVIITLLLLIEKKTIYYHDANRSARKIKVGSFIDCKNVKKEKHQI